MRDLTGTPAPLGHDTRLWPGWRCLLQALGSAALAWLCVGLATVPATVLAQARQLAPGRIDDLPDLPSPYEMRDWRAVARGADALMFDPDATGQYLPLVRFRRPYNGRLLTDSIFGVPSYVGDTRGEGLEGILTLPSVVSGLLVGIDKRDQGGVDYVRMTQDWFSRRDNEFVYLNLPLTSTGSDWWYETMPNVFFQHIYDLAGPYGAAEQHFVTLADQWTRVVGALGGSATPWSPGFFNYRSFRIRDLTPVSGGVPEPEAAGAIGYLLENAWRETGDERYRWAAEQSLEYLDGLDRNPRYELQLLYGVQAAARLNALERTGYDLETILGWALSRGNLRGWGMSVAESDDGRDLHGLVGETERGNDYLFFMNSVQAAATLAPVARYDNRFARALGKYVLHVANNSRLFYWNYLSPAEQDSYAWASTYDPNGYLAYEALRQRLNGESPFATGDAIRLGWAPTNIGLYGSAHTGYLGALVDTTDVTAVLALDLNATDFLAPPSYPTRLYYNPYDSAVTVTAQRPAAVSGQADVYEAVSGQWLARATAGDYALALPAGEAALVTWVPTGGTVSDSLNGTFVDGIAIDYDPRIIAPEGILAIKALALTRDTVQTGDTVQLHVTMRGAFGGSIDYDVLGIDSLPLSVERLTRLDDERAYFTLRAGATAGTFRLRVRARPQDPNAGAAQAEQTLTIVTASAVDDDDAAAATAVVARPNPTTGPLSLKLPPGRYVAVLTDALGRSRAIGNYDVTGSGLDLDLGGQAAGLIALTFTERQSGRRYLARAVVAY